MAEVIGIVASAITVGASAAQLSLALFSVAQTLKHAPKQIAEIAEEFSLVSESLQSLADIIKIHQDMCKPALFKNTQTIILRYKQVDAEIKKLIDTPQKLAGLQWLINKPKAKGLLKKVEGIKTALILELNIIRLAREEFARPHSNIDASVSAQSPSRFNRFRKIVESAVQANRQVVEDAQQDDDNSGTGKRRCTDAELDVWKEGSYDTATWLYHLVFSPGVLEQPEANPNRRRLQASVVDDSGSSSDAASTANGLQSDVEEKAMIVWSEQTEPSLVVDRLLSSWTTLSSDQITLTSANQDGDEWREDLLRMIEEAKKEDELSFDQWEQQNQPVRSDDEESIGSVSMPTYNFHSNKKNHRRRSERKSTYDNICWDDASEESSILDHARIHGATDGRRHQEPRDKRSSHEHQVRWDTHPSSTERSHSHTSRRKRQTEKPRPRHADEKGASFTIYGGRTSSSTNIPRRNSAKDTETSCNPFASNQTHSSINSGYVPPWQEPYRGPHFQAYRHDPSNPAFSWPDPSRAYAHPGATPYHAHSPPPSLPPQAYTEPIFMSPLPQSRPSVAPPEQSKETETAAKEKAIVTAIEELLEKRDQGSQFDSDDPRFLRLVQMLTAQQEREAQNERERANTAVQAQMKLVQVAHDKDYERLKQLEYLAEEQKQEQRLMQAIWKEERLAMEEKASKQAQEARNQVKKEMAMLQNAKKEAERQTQKLADDRAAEERKRMEGDHKQQLQHYEDLLQGFREQQLKSEQDAQHPVRRTRIAEGNRSVDVTEYSTDKRAPPFFTSTSSLRNFQGGFAQFDLSQEQPSGRRRPPRFSRHDSFHGSVHSLHSSRASLGTPDNSDPTEASQQLIVFPSKADRGSKRIAELQRSLTALGIDSVFEDPSQDHVSQLVSYEQDGVGDQTVRSTIFWEASMLSLGSELLLTMRQAGWRPTYTRISEKGQTYFLGNQPIHTYFFSPDYRPQFAPSMSTSAKESITIQKALVEEYALTELGFEYRMNDTGVYILDGRLTYHDIETLVERSFLMRENNYRRMHRQLQWYSDQNTKTTSSSPYPDTYAPSLHTASSAYSGGDNRTTCEDADTDTEAGGSSAASTTVHSEFIGINVHDFRIPPSEGSQQFGVKRSDVPSLSRDESPVKSPSIASWVSKSTNNPFRKHMDQAKEDMFGAGSDLLGDSIWDDPVAAIPA